MVSFAMSFSMNAMMSSMLVDTRGSISGFECSRWRRGRDPAAGSLMRPESAGSSPFSFAP
jgi:hypothetical protein